MTDYHAFRDRLTALLPRLTARMEDGARHVLDHPDDVVILSMRDLARRARVSPATLVRLASAVGLGGWPELRAIHTAHFRRVPPAYADRAAEVIARPDGRDLPRECFAAGAANLDHTRAANPGAEFLRAATILAAARRVHVAAFMSCRGPGHTFTYLARMLRDDVSLLGAEGVSLSTELQTLTQDDALLAINFRPYGRDIAQVAQAVSASGAALVCLTDSRATPLTPMARATLLFAPESPSFFPSLTAAMAAVEALLAAMLQVMGEDARVRIGEIERRLWSSGSYLGDADLPTFPHKANP